MSMSKSIQNPFLYLGDDSIDGAAAYLTGVMTHFGLDYVHRPSDTALEADILKKEWSALIISDYPAGNISGEIMKAIAEKAAAGMGFLMIGGWESYQGQAGHYHGTTLGNILPVTISPDDDRVNSSGPCLISKVKNHPIINGLPIETDVPGIGGFNKFVAKEGAEVVLDSRRYTAIADSNTGHRLIPLTGADPLLVTGQYGMGRVCAWASDVAPHWVGGLVDWGDERVESGSIEVGDLYAAFFANMLRWTAGLLD